MTGFFISPFPLAAQTPISQSDPTSTSALGGNGAASPGPTRPWLGGSPGLNIGTGNYFTEVSFFSWPAKGGFPIGFALYHNSQGDTGSSAYNDIGLKWNYSYNSYLTLDSNQNATIYWDNGNGVTFPYNAGTGKYTPVPGQRGTFEAFPVPNLPIIKYYYQADEETIYEFRSDYGNRLVRISNPNSLITINRSTTAPYHVNTVSDENGRTLTINWSGNLITSVSDYLSRVWTVTNGNITSQGHTYNKIASVTWPSVTTSAGVQSYKEEFEYNESAQYGNITKHKDKNGNYTYYGYNINARPGILTDVTDALTNHSSYSYQSDRVVATDPNNHTSTFHITNGYMDWASQTINGAPDIKSYYHYDTNFNLDDFTDPNGNHWTAGYSGNNLTVTRTPEQYQSSTYYTSIEYNNPNYPTKATKVTDAYNHWVSTTYDGSGNPTIRQRSGVSGSITAHYPANSSGLPDWLSDPMGNPHTQLIYDTKGALETIIDPNGNGSTTHHDPTTGWVDYTTDGIGNKTSVVRDEWGRVTRILAPIGTQVPFYRFDLPDGVSRVYTSWEGERASLATTSGNAARGVMGYLWQSDMNTAGITPLHRVRNPSNNDDVYTASDSEWQNYLGLGWTDMALYGWVWSSPPPTAAGTLHPVWGFYNSSLNRHLYTTVQAEYNSLAANSAWRNDGVRFYLLAETGTVTSQTSIVYDGNSNVTSVTDGNYNTTRLEYDADDRLVKRTDANNNFVQYIYDLNGRKGLLYQKSIPTPVGATPQAYTTYTYDDVDRIISINYPGNTTESFTYDQNSNILTHIDENNKMRSFAYDKQNRLIHLYHPSDSNPVFGTNYDYTYDQLGHMKTMTDQQGTTTWNYDDPAGRLHTVLSPQGNVTYGYDDNNRVNARNVSGIGTWFFAYDAGGRNTAISNPSGEFTTNVYDAADRLVEQYLQNGNMIFNGYDGQSRLVDITHLTNTFIPFRSMHYGYDPGGNITRKIDDTKSFITQYTYDATNQLKRELLQDGSNNNGTVYDITYNYDARGNRLNKTLNGTPTTYSYDVADHLLSSNGPQGVFNYFYDNKGQLGNVTLNGAGYSGMVWDTDGRMVTFVPYQRSSTQTSSRYNGLGLRVQKADVTGTYNFVTDGKSPGSPVLSDGSAVYTPGISERRNNQTSYYQNDLLGSPTSVTNSGGGLTDNSLFEAFGLLVYHQTAGNAPNPMGFGAGAGYQTDQDTGAVIGAVDGNLILMGNRFYAPGLGRFISKDPAGSGDNWYTYCDNNPVSNIDPLGLLGHSTDPGGDAGSVRYSYASFIPGPNILAPFIGMSLNTHMGGDDRGFDSKDNRFRLQQSIIINPKAPKGKQVRVEKKVGRTRAVSGAYEGWSWQASTDTLHSAVTETKTGWLVHLWSTAGDPAYFGLAPPIGYNLWLSFDSKGQLLQMDGRRTDFPAAELWRYKDGDAPSLKYGYMPPDGKGAFDLYSESYIMLTPKGTATTPLWNIGNGRLSF